MPNKGSGEGEKQSKAGARRMAVKDHPRPQVPSGESTKEAGTRRLYAAPGSTGSTSTQESGPRRLYTSAAGPGQHPTGHRAMRPQR